MKTYNCVHPRCNKKAQSYCGHVMLETPNGKKKITAGLCDEHSKKMFKPKTMIESEWVEPWKNGKPWRKKNGLTYFNKRLDPNTMCLYGVGTKIVI